MAATHLRNVRLTVHMPQFFAEGDHRSKALVILQRTWQTVQQLQDHIQKIFRLPGQIYLTVADCLLPTDEHISVVNEADNITVQPVRQNFAALADAFSNAHLYSANETTPGAWTSDQSSPGIFALNCVQSKRRRKSSTLPALPDDETPSPGKSARWIRDIDSLDVPPSLTENAEEPPAKPKRHRKRKRKQAKPATSESTDVRAEQQPPSAVLSGPVSSTAKVHIRFDEDTDENGGETTTVARPALPKNEPFALPATARVIRGTVCSSSTGTVIAANRKAVGAIESPVAECAAPGSAAGESAAAAIPPVVEPMATDKAEPKSAIETLCANIPLMDLKAVGDKLQERDTIAFRIMKLSENYMPGMSEYIIGIVQTIDDESVSLHIMAGLQETREPTGKFSLQAAANSDDEDAELLAVGSAEEDRTFNVQRADMFDVKYVELNCM